MEVPMPKGVERNPITVIILSIVTCGIYSIYWLYMVTKEINAALGEERINFVMYFLLGILCFPLIFVGMYKIDEALVLQGRSNFVLWIILSFVGVGFFIMIYQVQESMNELWAKG
jgi:hypothetical protein